ncbi:hypothetical protein DEU56DRAFT_908432 [Suillus clintonianus]|uniref:uncharacterized protein n=1 Tax=Suillus clintonianus TaxID=1904413 RepID=UPI001B869C68|nr:uncharacterized protein DEU56DRAFT_908432 [Suillus clintonianus]KAG2150794.1 hypothetical protein DEU56DRAFT_908432 [Suillus clintonianus]
MPQAHLVARLLPDSASPRGRTYRPHIRADSSKARTHQDPSLDSHSNLIFPPLPPLPPPPPSTHVPRNTRQHQHQHRSQPPPAPRTHTHSSLPLLDLPLTMPMSDNASDHTVSLRIWQQNLNTSPTAQASLLKSPNAADWDLITIQEPHINFLHNTSANHHWHVLYPTQHYTHPQQCT